MEPGLSWQLDLVSQELELRSSVPSSIVPSLSSPMTREGQYSKAGLYLLLFMTDPENSPLLSQFTLARLTDPRWLGVEEAWIMLQQADGSWIVEIYWDHHDGSIPLFDAHHTSLLSAVKLCLFKALWEREYWKNQPKGVKYEPIIQRCNGAA